MTASQPPQSQTFKIRPSPDPQRRFFRIKSEPSPASWLPVIGSEPVDESTIQQPGSAGQMPFTVRPLGHGRILVHKTEDGPVEWNLSDRPDQSGNHGFFRIMTEGDFLSVPGRRYRITSREVFAEPAALRPAMQLEGRNVTVVNGRGEEAYAGISIKARAGELTCLIGPSGSGKSTLIKAIMGIDGFRLTRNRFLVNHGSAVAPVALADVSYVGQELDLYPELTVTDQIASHARIFAGRGVGIETIREAMQKARFPLDRLSRDYGGTRSSRERLYVKSLSGGEKKRLALGLALLRPSVKILALDEVTSGLDPGGDALTMDTLRDIVTRNGYIGLIVTHTLSNIRADDWIVPVIVDKESAVPRRLHSALRFSELFSHFGVLPGPDAPKELMEILDPPSSCHQRHRCAGETETDSE